MATASATQLPTGVVTMLFTDIEGSTRLLHDVGDAYGELIADHHRLLRETWREHGGVEVHGDGDSFLVGFAEPRAALQAAAAAQEALARHRWPHGGELRVRMGVHSGTVQVRNDDYWGIEVHYAARLCTAAHGGQVLVSELTRALVPEVAADDLGQHGLKDFPAPRRVYQLRMPGSGRTGFPPPRTLETARSNLPSVPTAIVGREREIESVRDEVQQHGRMVTVTGTGGSGKTRLALACGEAMLDDFADGVFLVSLASVTEEADVPASIGSAIGAPLDGDAGAEALVTEHLRGRELLLILDNMEHLPEVASLVSRLVQAAPGVHVLATSQAPLRVSGEIVAPLGPLDFPHEGESELDVIASYPAVALFAERARASDPSFDLTAENAAPIAELCRRLEGLPLALELAAARLRVAGPSGLLNALARGADVLGTGGRDLPERQRGLRAALDWTVSLLGADERRLFPALGVFAEAWTLDHAERAFGDDLDVWDASSSLLEFSLIRTRGDGRFAMAEAVRAYARDQLERDGRADECRARHARLMAEEAEAIDDEIPLAFSEQVARTVELASEFAAAVDWAAGHDRELHRRLVAALGRPYFYADGASLSALSDDVMAYAAAPDQPRDTTSARLMLAQAMVLKTIGSLEGGVEALGRAVERFHQLSDDHREALAMIQHAHMLNLLNGDDALSRSEEMMHVAEKLPAVVLDRRLQNMVDGTKAINLMERGRLEEAEALLREIAADPTRTDRVATTAPNNLAECALIRGDYDAALHRFVDCVGRSGRSHMYDLMTDCLSAAQALAGLRRDAEAIELLAAVRAAGERDGGIVLPDDDDPRLRGVFTASRARLDPDEIVVLEQRGRARTTDEMVDWVLSLTRPATAPIPNP